jgi:bifunctional enzyme CysN/CysC
LRFITCGSVDDGKSTLIGRLLYDSRQVFDDRLKALQQDSRRFGTRGDALDFSLLVDGLRAEREQGITIDVAYRFFTTEARSFIVADTPGHEQYTRNMATAASTASLAVLLVDARKGIVTQTRRHTRIVALFGVRHLVVAVNKIDLVGFSEAAFAAIADEFSRFAAACGVTDVLAVPTCATHGDNVVDRSARMPWYSGPTLLEALEQAATTPEDATRPFRLPVQCVVRTSSDFRGYSGRIASGCVRVGDEIHVQPAGLLTRVKAVHARGDNDAGVGESILLTLVDEVDVGRGDVLSAATAPAGVADQFEATLLWMGDSELVAGRPYFLKIHSKEVPATITGIKFRLDVNTGARLAAKSVARNEIVSVNISTAQPVVFEPYAVNRRLGAFILIDRHTNGTVGAGMIQHALRRSTNIRWQHLDVSKAMRGAQKSQKPLCLWFTGLSGSGKSTIANLVEKKLVAAGRHTYLLDGDNVRHGLNRDLGFTEADRVENIRRVAEVSRLMVDAGLIVLVSFISPFRAERRLARELMAPDEFIEIFVDTPLEECERRDPKGLYARWRNGLVKNLTGLDSAYEPPDAAELSLNTLVHDAAECADRVCRLIGG